MRTNTGAGDQDMNMNIESDPRYTITREWCGRSKPQFVVRFCGDWVSCHSTQGAALTRAVSEASQRRGALVVEEVTP